MLSYQAVLLLQNGWGSANEVRDILPESVAIFSSIMMIGISRRSAGHVHVNVQASPVRVGTLFASAAHGMQAAVGALTKMTYGELVTNANTRDLIAKLADETIRCMHAERKHLLAANGVAYFETALMPLVIPRGAAHRSSMLQDVEAGRRTEIDYLNGAVVRMGQSHGIATPFNEVVSGLIRASCPTD